jgi:predicted DCC family thiol-disulfide oxidoreductase YuxK
MTRGTRPGLLVLYDGGCGFCIWTIAIFLRLDRRRRLSTGSIQVNRALLGGMSDAEALGSFHAVDENGDVRSAGAALVAVLSALPLTRPFGWLLARVPRTADRLYYLVALRRGPLARLIPERSKRAARDLVGVVPGEAPSCSAPGTAASCAVPAVQPAP